MLNGIASGNSCIADKDRHMTQAIAADASARFVPPTPVQLAAAQDIVGRFAARWAHPRAEDLAKKLG